MKKRTAYLFASFPCLIAVAALWSLSGPTDFPVSSSPAHRLEKIIGSVTLKHSPNPTREFAAAARQTPAQARHYESSPAPPATVSVKRAASPSTSHSSGRRPHPATPASQQSPDRRADATPASARTATGLPLPAADPDPASASAEILAPLAVPFSLFDATTPAGIPAALASAAPGEAQPPGLDEMTDDFLTKVSPGSQNPQDPEYQRLWEETQMLSDIRMKAAYGDAVWLKKHQEAHRQALGNSVVPSQEPSQRPTAPRPN